MFSGRLAILVVLIGACSDESAPRDTAPDTTDTTEIDAPEDTAEVDTGPPPPATIAERGFTEVRLIAHLHSAYSHDGCDNMGLDAEGKPNAECVRRLKRALCAERIGHVFMTDHPSNMRDQPWPALFYADPPADDELLLQEDGTPWAARFACEAGEGGPDGRVTFMVGFEGTHTMALGLRRQIDWERYHAFEDSAAPADLAATTAAVAEAGGRVSIAHSEEDDLSAETIAAHDVAAMEVYNFHANFNEVLGGGLGEALFALEYFLDPDAEVPDPDLVALILLKTYPLDALTKWRAVSSVRPIVGFAGADAHENVSFNPACKDTDACDGIARLYPSLVEYLKIGGPVWQSDRERLDGYARVFRWVQNRVYVASPGPDSVSDPLAVEAAFFAGRSAVVFEVLGDAPGFALIAETSAETSAGTSDGTLHDLGETLPLTAGTTLWARAPDLPEPPAFARWTDGTAASIEAVVWRTADGTSEEVARWSTPGEWRAIPVTEPGAYQLEVLITPRHLAAELGPAAAFADETYRWVETNAIRFE